MIVGFSTEVIYGRIPEVIFLPSFFLSLLICGKSSGDILSYCCCGDDDDDGVVGSGVADPVVVGILCVGVTTNSNESNTCTICGGTWAYYTRSFKHF